MERKHSPLPFKLAGVTCIFSPDGKTTVAVAGSPRGTQYVEYKRLELSDPDFDEACANAAFLLHAANNHYQLLEALKEATYWLRCAGRTAAESGCSCETLTEAEDLIFKAIADAEKE